jgi:hypothetical protein|tara:strand:+ start:481 stop:750 length:270 start_codon:yes stop_codon:yes gene_type:complete
MIPIGLKAGSMGLKILRQLYGAKVKVGKATKKVADYAGKEGFTKTSKTISGVAKKTHEGTKIAKKYAKKYPKSAAAISGAVAFDIFDDD